MTGECECCGANGIPTRAYDLRRPLIAEDREPKMRDLCELCAGTMTSTFALQYPSNHDHDIVTLMQTVCFVGNMIRKDLRRRRRK